MGTPDIARRTPLSNLGLRPTDSRSPNGDSSLRTIHPETPLMTSVGRALALAALVVTAAVAPNADAQPSPLPFAVGERLEYVGKVRGISGRGSMWVDGP